MPDGSPDVPRHPDADDVRAARDRITGVADTTPLVWDEGLSGAAGFPVYLKAECLQVTGSFKVRGAANFLMALPAVERRAGVVAVSSGNHGRAVAHVARSLGTMATICLSERVPDVKVEAIRDLGAHIVVGGPTQDDAEAAARRVVAETGAVFVHPFDDPSVIAGQGTVGLEIVDQADELDTVVVPLSGGGLISGIALAVKASLPGVRVIGVSQELGPAMYDSLQAGEVTGVVEVDTLADALAGGLGEENHHTFELCRELLDGTVLVSEGEIAGAMKYLHDAHGWRVEGGGAVGVAAVQTGKVTSEGPMAIVVSGGNVSDEVLRSVGVEV